MKNTNTGIAPCGRQSIGHVLSCATKYGTNCTTHWECGCMERDLDHEPASEVRTIVLCDAGILE